MAPASATSPCCALCSPSCRGTRWSASNPLDRRNSSCGARRDSSVSVAPRVLGSALLMRGDVNAAVPVLANDAERSLKAGDLVGAMTELRLLAGAHLIQGHLREAQRLFEASLAVSGERTGTLALAAVKSQAGLSEVLRERNDLQAAIYHATQARDLEPESAGHLRHGCSCCPCPGQPGPGRHRQRPQRDEEAARLAAGYKVTDLDDLIVHAHRARLWLAQGQVDTAAGWARRGLDQARVHKLCWPPLLPPTTCLN